MVKSSEKMKSKNEIKIDQKKIPIKKYVRKEKGAFCHLCIFHFKQIYSYFLKFQFR